MVLNVKPLTCESDADHQYTDQPGDVLCPCVSACRCLRSLLTGTAPQGYFRLSGGPQSLSCSFLTCGCRHFSQPTSRRNTRWYSQQTPHRRIALDCEIQAFSAPFKFLHKNTHSNAFLRFSSERFHHVRQPPSCSVYCG